MNFRKQLELEHSKKATTKIVSEICQSNNKMGDLMNCFIEGPVQITQRAAWPISFIAEKHPELLNEYYPIFIKLLNTQNKHNSINRNILRAFQYVEVPQKHEGAILDVCFKLLNSSSEPIAVKAFAITVIYNLSKKYPDIIPELKASIEALLPNASAGLKNRGNKILNAIKK